MKIPITHDNATCRDGRCYHPTELVEILGEANQWG
jgi:hypothetical protein